MGKLTIFRGLPGAGKSKLARQLAEQTGALFVEPDMLMIKHSKYCYEKELFKSAVHDETEGLLVLCAPIPRRRNGRPEGIILPCRECIDGFVERILVENFLAGHHFCVEIKKQ